MGLDGTILFFETPSPVCSLYSSPLLPFVIVGIIKFSFLFLNEAGKVLYTYNSLVSSIPTNNSSRKRKTRTTGGASDESESQKGMEAFSADILVKEELLKLVRIRFGLALVDRRSGELVAAFFVVTVFVGEKEKADALYDSLFQTDFVQSQVLSKFDGAQQVCLSNELCVLGSAAADSLCCFQYDMASSTLLPRCASCPSRFRSTAMP